MKVKNKIGFIALITTIDIMVIILVVIFNGKTEIKNDINNKFSANILKQVDSVKLNHNIIEKDLTENDNPDTEELEEQIEKEKEEVSEKLEEKPVIEEEASKKNEIIVSEVQPVEAKEERIDETEEKSEEVEEIISEPVQLIAYDDMSIEEKEVALKAGTLPMEYSGLYTESKDRLTNKKGVVYFNGHRETYYSERVLPGAGLKIPGRHVADDGTIRDEEGYICVAADQSYMAKGTVLITSLGPAKVYDTGCAYGTIDIYVNW